MKEKMSVLLLTCNRKALSERTIRELYKRVKNPEFLHVIVVDNASEDGTKELLEQLLQEKKIHVVVNLKKSINICSAYNVGLQHVETEYFLTMQDDVIIPELKPDVVEQLVDLMNKNPNVGGIGCRIQRIPNVRWTDGDLSPARKALSAYCRIQKKSDVIKMGGFGDRNWDDIAFQVGIRKLGKDVCWANNLWCNHLGYMIEKRGYGNYDRKWSSVGSHTRIADLRKPYPKVDKKTNIPLPGERIYK